MIEVKADDDQKSVPEGKINPSSGDCNKLHSQVSCSLHSLDVAGSLPDCSLLAGMYQLPC